MGEPIHSARRIAARASRGLEIQAVFNVLLASMISEEAHGSMTKRCSTVPCSRSRIAPAWGMTVSSVIWLMTWVIAENHAVLVRVEGHGEHEIDRRAGQALAAGSGRPGSRWRRCGRACAVARLGSRSGVDGDLDAGLALGAHIGLEVGGISTNKSLPWSIIGSMSR